MAIVLRLTVPVMTLKQWGGEFVFEILIYNQYIDRKRPV